MSLESRGSDLSSQIHSQNFSTWSQIMLCHARHKARSILLPDFLVPCLLNYKDASSSASLKTRDGLQLDRERLTALPTDRKAPPELYKNITERLNALQSGISMSVPDENIDVFNTAASKLRYALKAGDILGASKHWCSLEE